MSISTWRISGTRILIDFRAPIMKFNGCITRSLWNVILRHSAVVPEKYSLIWSMSRVWCLKEFIGSNEYQWLHAESPFTFNEATESPVWFQNEFSLFIVTSHEMISLRAKSLHSSRQLRQRIVSMRTARPPFLSFAFATLFKLHTICRNEIRNNLDYLTQNESS